MFKEGSFWHAYEWSAWLICVITYNNEKHKRENTGDPIAVVHKPIGGKNQQGTYTMVGFQIKSLDKFVPNRVKLETIDDKQMDIEIELPHDDTPLTYERLQKAFEEWKGQQKLSKKDDDDESEKPQKPRQPHQQSPTILTDIEAQLLAWPLEQKSPLGCCSTSTSLLRMLPAISARWPMCRNSSDT
jgi:hypothetical protein